MEIMNNAIRFLSSPAAPSKMINLEVGLVVRFKKNIEELEIDLDEGMYAVVCGSVKQDGMVLVTFDTSLFEAFNKIVAKNTYYNDKGVPSLTAWESGCWPKNNKHTVYFEENSMSDQYFEIDGRCVPNC